VHSSQILDWVEHRTLYVYSLELRCCLDKILQVFKFYLCNRINNIDSRVVIVTLLHLLRFWFDISERCHSRIAALNVFTYIEVPAVTLNIHVLPPDRAFWSLQLLLFLRLRLIIIPLRRDIFVTYFIVLIALSITRMLSLFLFLHWGVSLYHLLS
jgi:hypothetical protein